MNDLSTLEVVDIKTLTKQSVQVDFKLPIENERSFLFKPGQYITLSFKIGGEEYRRAYSICSSHNTKDTISVGVKRVKNGKVSNHINDQLQPGSKVEVLPPMGDFFADIQASNYKSYYLFAAGSGITPMLSILKSVLETEDKSYVYLLYGNSNLDSIMFKDELKRLLNQYSDRLIVQHNLSKPKSKLGRLFKSSKSDDVEFTKGRIEASVVKSFIKNNPPYAQNTEYYMCGPNMMMETIEESLKNLDVPKSRIFKESFGADSNVKSVSGQASKLQVNYSGENFEIEVKKDQTLLRALLNNNIDVQYSCEGGVCGMCKSQLVEGEVHMESNMYFTQDEVNNGNILCCQSVPKTPNVSIYIKE